MEISGRTKMICLLGSPVAHSMSPAMHNEAFAELGLDYRYLAFDVKEGELAGVMDSFRRMGVRGFNLTMPLKTEAVALCDRLSPAAEIAGSVNTVVLEDDGTATGHTTDGIGFTESARQEGVDFRGQKVTLLGTGGAGIAILVQLALDGAREVAVFERANSRFHDRTTRVVSQLNERSNCHVTVYDYDDAVMQQQIAESCLLRERTRQPIRLPHRRRRIHWLRWSSPTSSIIRGRRNSSRWLRPAASSPLTASTCCCIRAQPPSSSGPARRCRRRRSRRSSSRNNPPPIGFS